MDGAQAIGTGDAVSGVHVPSRRRAEAERLRRMVATYFDFIWRSLRRLGVPESGIDDAVQQVWIVASRKLAAIGPDKERAFLFGTALRVAADARRAASRRPIESSQDVVDVHDPAPRPDEILDDRRARELLDRTLAALPEDLRVVFVLFELEELPSASIAATLDIPLGTVASRLRRAREEFRQIVKRTRARDDHASLVGTARSEKVGGTP